MLRFISDFHTRGQRKGCTASPLVKALGGSQGGLVAPSACAGGRTGFLQIREQSGSRWVLPTALQGRWERRPWSGAGKGQEGGPGGRGDSGPRGLRLASSEHKRERMALHHPRQKETGRSVRAGTVAWGVGEVSVGEDIAPWHILKSSHGQHQHLLAWKACSD